MNQSETLPTVTVIIPARPGEAEVKAVSASRALDYPADKLEIILARGKQPSAQRNAAIKSARGEILYFLDDDSIPPRHNLRRAAEHFRDPQVQMVGGPNVCPPDAPQLERIFALVLGSKLAFGPSRARYVAVGQVRATSEKELILCNLASRRQAMIDAGGFNEALYPNEENALMDELQKKGGKLIYDPQFIVHRRPRSNLSAFARMLRTYGRGRAEQFRLHPTTGSMLNFVPPLFCLYLLSLLVVPWFLGWIFFLPLAAYALIVLLEAANLSGRGGIVAAAGAVPLIVMTHVLYGFGFLLGMFTRLSSPQARPPTPVQLETVPPTG